MTEEEMATVLRDKGYRVEAPIKHMMISGEARVTFSDGRVIIVYPGMDYTIHFNPAVEIIT